MRPFCFIDLETTGTDREKDHIVQIGIVNEEKSWERLVDPGVPIPKEASDIHGITDGMVQDQPAFAVLALQIMTMIEGRDIVGFNCLNFDVPMLYFHFLRAGITWDWKKHAIIDVCNIMKRNEERTLAAAFKFYTGSEMANAHGVSADINATIAVFNAQRARYATLPQDNDALALYSNYDRKIVDITGKFVEGPNGDILLNFGKHQGKRAIDNLDYLSWMLSKDFPPDALDVCRSLLGKGR